MAKGTKPKIAAIGFRVKTGRAVVVLVAGSPQSPQVLDTRIIQLSDPGVPDSRQPYHVPLDNPRANTERELERLKKLDARVAKRSVTQLLKKYHSAGFKIRGVALVVGSLIDPSRIGNPHIRAHAMEGQLFRKIVEDAVRSAELRSIVIVERELYSKAAKLLKRSEVYLKLFLAQIGHSLEGPWRAEEKSAALAALMMLQ